MTASLIIAMYLSIGANFCGGVTHDGIRYEDFVAAHANNATHARVWNSAIERGQKNVCGE